MNVKKKIQQLRNEGDDELADFLHSILVEHQTLLDSKRIREKIANLAHEQWSGWMEYLFSKSSKNKNGCIVIPKSFVDRWERQVQTSYLNLSDEEQESDRKEADKFLSVIKKEIKYKYK